ncbi:MAG: DUF1592 domain-containing protein [Planctomycetaceae bacterium]
MAAHRRRTIEPTGLAGVRLGILGTLLGCLPCSAGAARDAATRFTAEVRPILARHCHACHAGDDLEGDVDLASAATLDDLRGTLATWQRAAEVIRDGQMPPAEAPQPTAAERQVLEEFLHDFLRGEAAARAGDPGLVVLRRLDNAEYTYTIRDLTGIATLDPAREFPTDGAAGEGFSNTGQALVMSPALAEKYLDAAKGVAAHAMLLPDGMRFAEGTSEADWTDACVERLRAFYRRFTAPLTGTMQNVAQGIAFDLGREGGLPIAGYLVAADAEGDRIAAGDAAGVAQERGLSAGYLARVVRVLNAPGHHRSPLLESVRHAWRRAKPLDPAAGDRLVAEMIAPWQQALWKFNPVGQIARQYGRPDGPAAWMEPVERLVPRQEFRVTLAVAPDQEFVVVRLVAADAGDGREHDFVVWENPRLVADGTPDLHVGRIRRNAAAVARDQAAVAAALPSCLAALDEEEAARALGRGSVPRADLAATHGVDRRMLDAWADLLGESSPHPAEGFLLTTEAHDVAGHASVAGWAGGHDLSVLVNSGSETLRIPAALEPGGVVVHPAPERRAVVAWRSPEPLTVRVEGSVAQAHVGCGNGVAWSLELRRGGARLLLASGTTAANQAARMPIGPLDGVVVRRHDRVCLVVDAGKSDHACDSTAITLAIRGDGITWDLATDLGDRSPGRGIRAGNPVPDASGRKAVWELGGEPRGGRGWMIPRDSLLARWQDASTADRRPLVADLARLVAPAGGGAAAADRRMRDMILSPAGPILSRLDLAPDTDAAADAAPAFGRHPTNSGPVAAADLCVQAPATVEFAIPAALAAGREFVVAAGVHPAAGGDAAVQAHVLLADTAVQPLSPAEPVIAAPGGAAWDRFAAACAEFRELFPPAVCYARVVPADEVITLNVFYREDERLRRLLLDDAQAAELDSLWDELLFVSQEPFRLQAAHEQLVQFATQDRSDLVSVFEALKPAIDGRAAAFAGRLQAAEPLHVAAVADLAARAWRRPVAEPEAAALRGLHAELRADGLSHDEAVRLLIARVLVAPAFLYKLELPASVPEATPVTGRELATRLSYFLWSSLPDADLAAAAERLQETDVLLAETRRMIRDPRIRRLAVEFGTHWLHVHGFDTHDEKSETEFPEFAALRGAMHEEAVLLLTDLFQQDRSILSLIDADHTFLDESLAGHYGIPGVTGPEWRRVDGVREHGRGGVLTLAAALAKQSGASRTSPILRGTWFTEVLLGQKLPKPPKNVPPLAAVPPSGLSERELTALHSSHAACAGCHARFDAYGFALEEFDAIGRRRERDVTGRPVDAVATLPDGGRVAGADDLRRRLATVHAPAFERQFIRKLLGFALGRGIHLSDEPLLDDMQTRLAAADHRVGVAVEAIVQSPQFRRIRGRGEEEP